MPPPLAPGKVTFDDGKPSTVDQQAKDVAAFLDLGRRAQDGGAQAVRLGAR